ncbi:MAG: type II CAAX endopeptidase family protein [Bacteroidota bacterium]
MDAIIKKPGNAIFIAGIVIAVFFYPIVGHLVFAGKGYTDATVVGSRLFIWLEVLLLFVYARTIEKGPYLIWPESKNKAGFYFASVGALYLLALGAGFISKIPLLFGMHDDNLLVARMMSLVAKSWPLLIFTAVTAGATEELIFRGYVLPRLEAVFKNKYLPVIISSLAFGLLHFRYGSVCEVIFASLIGFIFGIHYQWYRNIKVLIVTHALVDFISLCIFKAALHYHLPIK